MSKQPQQADGEIHEDQFLNFLVNILTEAFSVELSENAEIDPEGIFEVLVGASADGISVSSLCEDSADAPSGNDVLHHLRMKFDPDPVASAGNTLLQQMSLKRSPNRWRSATTSTCGPTTVTKTTQTVSTTRKRNVEQPPSTRTRRCTHVWITNDTRWRCAVGQTAHRQRRACTAPRIVQYLRVRRQSGLP